MQTDQRLEATLVRLNERAHVRESWWTRLLLWLCGRGTEDPLLKVEGKMFRLSDMLILKDALEHAEKPAA